MGTRILFRTRGGPTQGWGNIFRLAAFAGHCQAKLPLEVVFAVEGPPDVIRYLKGRGFDVVDLPEDVSIEAEDDLLKQAGPFDLAIIEMLECHRRRQELLATHARRVVVFDDLLDHIYCADLVICGQDLPSYGNVALSDPRTRFLTGYDYFLFSPAYLPYAKRPAKIASKATSVLVAFGGGRYDVAYLKTAHALAALPQLKPTIVLGYAPTDLGRELRRILPDAQILGGVENMHERLDGADIAVVSAGYLKLEAALTKTPCVMLAPQWHQIPLAEQFTKATGAPYAGYMGFSTPDGIRESIAGLLPKKVRKILVERFQKTVDGQGTNRVFQEIFPEQG